MTGHDNLIPSDIGEDTGLVLFSGLGEGQQKLYTFIREQVSSNGQYFLSSLPTNTRAEKVKVHQLISRGENDIDEILEPKQFQVSDFVLSRIKFTNAEGETVTGPKITLVSPSGDVRSIIACIWIEQFLDLLPIVGFPPYDEPIVLSAKLNKGTGPNRFYSLVWVQ